jgi:cytoskeletal protein RodZ
MQSVGGLIKKTRIKKKISLKFISNKLKISLSYLEAIEKDDFSKTPGGVYTKGYIRSYSNFLNLDSNEIIDQYNIQISFSENEKVIELARPFVFYQSFFSFKLVSLVGIGFISVVFYFMFLHQSNILPKYVITPEVPETLMPKINEFELTADLFEINENNAEIATIKNNISLNEDNSLIESDQTSVIASAPTSKVINETKYIISIKAISSTWIQMRNQKDEIVFSKLMNPEDVYNYSFLDNYLITTGNAGNLIISIGGEVLGKLGKKGEVIESTTISRDYFFN